MPQSTSTPQAQPSPERVSTPWQVPWPDGCIARYWTVAGATVDLVEKPNEITVNCTGCPDSVHSFHFDPCCTGNRMEPFVTSQATQWAQAHAEKCRALPRPAVTR